MTTKASVQAIETSYDVGNLPTITVENGIRKLRIPNSSYSFEWPEGKIYEFRTYRNGEDISAAAFNNITLDMLMTIADLVYHTETMDKLMADNR